MAKNYVYSGERITVAQPYAAGVLSGQGMLVGTIFGVAAYDQATQNANVESVTEGVFDLTKEPSLAIAAGARVFWDNTNRRVTTVQNGNFPIGAATAAAAGADTTARVWIDGQAALQPGAIAARTLSLPVTAVANTDFTVTVPVGHMLRALQRTTTAYTGATVTLQVGITVGGAEIVAATDIKAVGARALTLVDANVASYTPLASATVTVRIVQTTPTAVGAGQLILEVLPVV